MEKKQCLECGTNISGRRDKKFCSDHCRASHSNKINSDQNKFMRNINNILRKNRRILESFNPQGTSKVTKTSLLDEGFKFSYFTNEYKTKSGKVYKFCYEYGYLQLEPNLYTIVLRKEYID